MKIILLQDVKDLGKKDDIREVNDGYARNYLIPRKLAAEATAANLHGLKQKKAGEDKKAKEQLDAAKDLAETLQGRQISVGMRAGEGGKPFGSVGSKEIAQGYKDQHGMELDKKKIQLPAAIRAFGVHQVPIRLHPQVTGSLTVLVKET